MFAAPLAFVAILAAALQPAARPMRANDIPFPQMMTLASLPAVRISEMQCGGYGQWFATQPSPPANAPSRADAERLSAEVARRIAADTAIPVQETRAFLNEYSREISFRVARAEDGGAAIIAERMAQCAPLFAAVRARGSSTAIAGLTPAGLPPPVNSGLAACHARYRVAATMASGEEGERYVRQAEQARSLALAGKSGDDLTRAEAALAVAVADETNIAAIDGEDVKLRLVICLPLLAQRRE